MEAELSRQPRATDESVGIPIGEPGPTSLGAPAKTLTVISRCPYCREEVRSERADWVACEGCLARHHTSCWSEHGSCASCQSPRALARQTPRRREVVTLLFAVNLFLCIACFALWTFRGEGTPAVAPAPAREAALPAPFTAANAHDEALLALGHLVQVRNNESFTNRIVLAAERYEKEGKATDAKLLRDVGVLALQKGPDAAFALLRADPALAASRPAEARPFESLSELRLAEKKLALEMKLGRRDSFNGVRVKWGRELLDLGDKYRRAGSETDAGRVEKAAQTIPNLGVGAAVEILEIGPWSESPAALVTQAEADRQRAVACEGDARTRLTQVLSGSASADEVIPDAKKLLLEASEGFARAGLLEDAETAKQANDALVTGKSVHKALKILTAKAEK